MRLVLHFSEHASILHHIDDPASIDVVEEINDAKGKKWPKEIVINTDNNKTYSYELNDIIRIEIFPRG